MSIAELYQKFKSCSGVSTDTRNIGEGVMFFALRGEKFNANEFAQQALEKGAKYVVIDEEKYATNDRCLLVGDVLYTLQKLANFHRNHFNIPIIGLTGSNGKTTNKELIAAVLSKKYNTYYTKGNLNNHIGVPLTILGLNETHEIAVIEMGANHQGEIRDLSAISEPTHGFITNVGKAHLEGFGGVEGVRKGKGELYDFLSKSGGTVFLNNQNTTLVSMHTERKFKETIFYGSIDTFYHAELLEDSPKIKFKDSNSSIYEAHLSGSYNFENMLTALTIGKYFGVSEQAACQAVADYNPDNNRSQVVEKGSNSIIMDAYNANPSSMAASIQNFMKLKTEKSKIVILGEMKELGEESPAEHKALGELVSKGNFDYVVLYGEMMQHALVHLPKAYYFTDKFSIHNWLQDKKFENAYILIKGSRGVSLETVVQFL